MAYLVELTVRAEYATPGRQIPDRRVEIMLDCFSSPSSMEGGGASSGSEAEEEVALEFEQDVMAG